MKASKWILLFAVGFVLCLTLITVLRMTLPPIAPVKPGDVNRDGRVNAIDLTMMARHMAGIYNLTPSQIWIGDVNRNGRIDQRDIDTLTDIIMERPVK